MEIKCIVVDDEPLARKMLQNHTQEVTGLRLLGSFKSALEAHAFIEKSRVDVIFLDINMPRLSGIEWIRQLKVRPLIVFTTAYSDYAVEAFEVEAIDFLMKPISLERFLASVERIKKALSEKGEPRQTGDFITIKEGKRIYKVNLNDINFLQAFGDYVRIFTSSKTYITKDRMHHFQEQLPDNFVQVHRSYIVNWKKIEYLEGNHLVVAGEKIPISKKYRTGLLKDLS